MRLPPEIAPFYRELERAIEDRTAARIAAMLDCEPMAPKTTPEMRDFARGLDAGYQAIRESLLAGDWRKVKRRRK